jgi:hypothetical protein
MIAVIELTQTVREITPSFPALRGYFVLGLCIGADPAPSLSRSD